MNTGGQRRPLASRSSPWAGWLARQLTRAKISPNAISATSMAFALAGGLGFIAAGKEWIPGWLGWAVGAVCVQLRLLCNLMDGMVAIEGGKKSATGGIWNEAPDRFADALFLVGAGIGAGHPWLGAGLAWAAAMTAYVRSLGAELTGKQDFCGPFAKPQRMAALTGFAIFMAIVPGWEFWFAPAILGTLLAGTVFTIGRRLVRLANDLKKP